MIKQIIKAIVIRTPVLSTFYKRFQSLSERCNFLEIENIKLNAHLTHLKIELERKEAAVSLMNSIQGAAYAKMLHSVAEKIFSSQDHFSEEKALTEMERTELGLYRSFSKQIKDSNEKITL